MFPSLKKLVTKPNPYMAQTKISIKEWSDAFGRSVDWRIESATIS
jgi:hypothetical protein